MSGILVLYSGNDVAGRNIAGILKGKLNSGEVKILEVDDVLYMKESEESPEICIAASRHSSESGKPTLSCHSPGNFGAAEFGGNPRELGIAPADYLSRFIRILKNNPVHGYETTLEATHHGPTGLKFPIMFVEIGSTEREWNDSSAFSTIADIVAQLTKTNTEELPSAIGFGGGHYCRKFTDLTEEYAMGHICPKYNLQNIDSEIVQQMIEKTRPRPRFALVEKKGVGSEKGRILEILKLTGLEILEV